MKRPAWPEIISDTSPLQYLHQVGLIHLLPALARRVVVPPSVVRELSVGRSRGINLPDLARLDWVEIRPPASRPVLPLVNDLGPGESEALMLALESPGSLVLLDDALARRVAKLRGIRFTGTLGLILDAKKLGLISAVRPLLDQLQASRFRLDSRTRDSILARAGEETGG